MYCVVRRQKYKLKATDRYSHINVVNTWPQPTCDPECLEVVFTTRFKISKLVGAELFNRVNTLGYIDKKEKAKLCGYDDYMEFIEAWLQASSDALDLNYSDG